MTSTLPFVPTRGWTRRVKSAIVHAIALASAAATVAYARAPRRRAPAVRLQADVDRANEEIALLREERALKDARAGEPVNRFPDMVRAIVRRLKALVPSMGKVRIAHVLARAGLEISAASVRRILRERGADPGGNDPVNAPSATPTQIHARRPGDVWHLDLTTVPTRAGFWLSWLPFALPQSWPFCWWVAVILDHFSRAIVGFAMFDKQPTGTQLRDFLRRASRKARRPPRNVITDHGVQFTSRTFRRWCRSQKVRHRFGAVGERGSIAVIERFFRTLKEEGTRRILVPFRLLDVRREIDLYGQ
jgi:transposase InsO family protein